MVERWLPFWEPQLVVACAIALQLSLSEQVTVGPNWLLPSLEGGLLIGLVIVSPHPEGSELAGAQARGDRDDRPRQRRQHGVARAAGASAAAPRSRNGHALILSGIVLWCTNVLLFGLWYWEVDRGGPAARARGERDQAGLPVPADDRPEVGAPPTGCPELVDYLYVSLTNATAFSPTDTMPLTPTAKWLMSVQSVASLVTVGLVVARAVNILQ